MKPLPAFIALLLALATAPATLQGCGRKGDPAPPAQAGIREAAVSAITHHTQQRSLSYGMDED